MSGLKTFIKFIGVVSLKLVTISTTSKDAINFFLEFKLRIGLSLPFIFFIDSSVFKATINLSHFAAAFVSKSIWPE